MPSLTPNYGFFLPLVNNVTDQDLWGGYLNSNFSSIDTVLATFEIVQSGKIDFFPFNAAPTGYLECNGALISRTTYANLWTAAQASGNIVVDGSWDLGMFSTGDLSTTFRIPDMRGELLRGWDHGKGTDSGRAIGTSQADAIASHTVTSTVTDPGHTHNLSGNAGGASGGATATGPIGGGGYNTSAGCSLAFTGVTVASSYAGAAETRAKNVAGMFCIKT